MNLQKIGKVLTRKFVGTEPSSYKKGIYRATVSQRLRNSGLKAKCFTEGSDISSGLKICQKQWFNSNERKQRSVNNVKHKKTQLGKVI